MDFKHAWRAIRRMPVLATVVVVSLGIGIGVNTAVFSWVQAVVLRPLPGVRDAPRFHLIEPRADTGSYPGGSWQEYRDLRERLAVFPEILAARMAPFTLGDAGSSVRIYGQLVSGNFFSALGMQPALGRFFRPDEAERPGTEPVAVVSHDFWHTRLGGAADVVGRTLRVNDQQLTVIGVAPERFQGTKLGLNFDIWIPATMAPLVQGGSRELNDRTMRGYSLMAKLPAGTSVAQAQAQLDQVMRQLGEIYPETNSTLQAEVLPFWQAPRGPPRMLATSLGILQAIMLVLLLAVCGNTANLVLARASARHREVGVRLALGAARSRIVWLILGENLLLALMGAALGIAIAIWATESMRAVPIIGSFPIRFQTNLDLASLGFAVALGIACGLIFGAAPAAQLSRVNPQAALQSGSRNGGRSALRNALMGVEVALALAVLLAAALFWRSFNDARDADPGFTREGVLLANYDYTGRNIGPAASRDFAARLLDRLHSVTGVDAAAIASAIPLDIHGLPLRSFAIEGRPSTRPSGSLRTGAASDQALSNTVTPGYLRTMGIPLLAGSDFADLRDAALPAQVIVNEEFVRRFVGSGEAIGRRVENRGTSYVIAGVARNSTNESFGEAPTPVVYFSYRDRPSDRGEIHLRTRAGSESLLAPELERIVRELDPSLPLYDVRTLNEHVEKNLFLRRIPARMFVVLGPLLLVLAAIGIYAVVAYAVSQRTTEIGVRLALGATSLRVVSQIVGESLRIVAAGAFVAWFVALFIAIHLVRGPIDAVTFVGVPLALLLVAAFASWLPARRATSVDVMTALRQD